jgi:hypothetical protein
VLLYNCHSKRYLCIAIRTIFLSADCIKSDTPMFEGKADFQSFSTRGHFKVFLFRQPWRLLESSVAGLGSQQAKETAPPKAGGPDRMIATSM